MARAFGKREHDSETTRVSGFVWGENLHFHPGKEFSSSGLLRNDFIFSVSSWAHHGPLRKQSGLSKMQSLMPQLWFFQGKSAK